MNIDFNDLEPPKNLNCVGCGYDVTGIAEHDPCPECGHTIVYSEACINQSKKKALIGMSLSVASCAFCFGCGYGSFVGLPSAMAGFLICESAEKDIELNQAHPSCASYISIGKVCGTLGVIMNLLMLAYMMMFIKNGPLITA